jgi:integrase
MTTPSDPRNQQPEKRDQEPKGKKRKQKRRAAGEGTVYRRKSDGRWVAELTLEDGRRKPFYGQTQEEAIARRKQAVYEQMQGRLATGPKQKVKDFFTYWLEEVHRPPAIRISTYKAYRSLARNHILPALGHIQLQKLTTPQIQRLYSAKLKEGLSARTVIAMHTKTKAGKRKIVLPTFVVDMLKHHRTEQLGARLKAGAKWKDQGIVFCNIYGGFLNPTIIQRHFTRLLKRAGLPPMRFHDMRHSAATLLLSMGVNPKVVQELLGHSSITMTLDVYSHVLPSMQEDAMNKMNDLFHHPDEGENKGAN